MIASACCPRTGPAASIAIPFEVELALAELASRDSLLMFAWLLLAWLV
jgi:hypothetical protein